MEPVLEREFAGFERESLVSGGFRAAANLSRLAPVRSSKRQHFGTVPISGQAQFVNIVGRNATSYKFQGFQCRNDLVHPLLLRISMSRYISKSILFLIFTVILCSGLYPKSLGEYFEPQLSAASYDHAASSAAASNNSFHELNLDSAAAATPSLERTPQKLCHFFDC